MPSGSEWWSLARVIWESWVGLMSGVAGLAMTAYGLWRRRELTGRFFLAVGLVCLFAALVTAWTSEHRQRRAAIEAINRVFVKSCG